MVKAKGEWEFEVFDYLNETWWAEAVQIPPGWTFGGPDRATEAAAKRDLARLRRMVKVR